MQVFDINVAPGAVRLIDQLATYIYFLNGSAGGGDTTIEIQPASGGQTVFLKPGNAYEFDSSESASRWSIRNVKGEGTIIGQILFASGRFTDNRVTGSVEVVDGGKARSLANNAFTAGGGLAAVAAQYPKVQLWNPVGSGKNLMLEAVLGTSAAAGSVSVRRSNAVLSTLGASPVSKRMDSAVVGVAQIYIENSAAYSGINPNLSGKFYPANSQAEIKFIEPIVIPPGWGMVAIGTMNTDLGAFFEYFEELQ